MEFVPTSEFEERTAKTIVEAAFKVHKYLGPGLLERVYEICLKKELEGDGSNVIRQVTVPIIYNSETLDEYLRLDMVVNGCVVVELKAVEAVFPVWKAQLVTYLKLSQNNLGLLINFNVPLIKDGITRIRRPLF